MTERKAQNARGTPYSQRRVAVRPVRSRFLIVCEGEKTEPNYFEAIRLKLRDSDATVSVTIRGKGYNTLSLVQYAVNQKKVDGYNYKKGDQIWCIFDRDSFPSQQFNDALSLAGQKGIKVAYSNEAFELWYILHFEFLNTGITRAAYIAKLTKLLNKPYEKNSHEIYDLLEPWQATAIANAKRLLTTYNPSKPEQDNPSTTVHLLIEELRKYIR